jgi:predicted small secreted protein
MWISTKGKLMRRSRLLALAAALLAPLLLQACNTATGIGRDVGAAGDAISNTAQKVQNKM